MEARMWNMTKEKYTRQKEDRQIGKDKINKENRGQQGKEKWSAKCKVVRKW
jgi:hypothetical protein